MALCGPKPVKVVLQAEIGTVLAVGLLTSTCLVGEFHPLLRQPARDCFQGMPTKLLQQRLMRIHSILSVAFNSA